MMRAALCVLALLSASCHAVLLSVERRGSAGIDDQSIAVRTDTFDKHAIRLPAKPFVNCFDAVDKVMPRATCVGDGPGAGFAGYMSEYAPPEETVNGMPAWMREASIESELANKKALLDRLGITPKGTSASPDGIVATVHPGQTQSNAQNTVAVELDISEADAQRLPPLSDDGIKVFVMDGAAAALGTAKKCADVQGPRPHCIAVTAARFQWQLAGGQKVTVYAAPKAPADYLPPRTLLSFIHMSDVQVREPNATLGGQRVSDQLDPLIQSFARDYDQEVYSAFVYEAFIETINAEIPARDCRGDDCATAYRPPPQFMIHTGDSIDSGLASEFTEFRTRSDHLRIPWYNVVGNHDVLGFGNLVLDPKPGKRFACTQTTTLLREEFLVRPRGNGEDAEREAQARVNSEYFSFAPFLIKQICLRLEVEGDRILAAPTDEKDRAMPRDRFINAHCRPSPTTDCAAAPKSSLYAAFNGLHSNYAGFDLHPKRHGYYAFSVEGPDGPGAKPRTWLVVLDTTSPVGAYGDFSKEQEDWLRAILVDHKGVGYDAKTKEETGATIKPSEVVLVFGHHPIWKIEDPKRRAALENILFDAGNVVAYFAGHTHTSELRLIRRQAAGTQPERRVWEVVAPSLIGFPRQARHVTMKTLPGTGLGYLEILSFEPHLEAQFQDYVDRAKRGAERDECNQYPDTCVDGHPKQAPNNLVYPRLWFKMPPPENEKVSPSPGSPRSHPG